MTNFLTPLLATLIVAVLTTPASAQVEQVLTSPGPQNYVASIHRLQDQGLMASIQRPNQPAIDIVLPTRDAIFTDLRVYQDSRAILSAGISPTIITILDLTNRTVADSFVAERPSVSPDAKYIVFTRRVGRVETTEIGAVYLLYDLTKNASANRMSNTPLTDSDAGVGTAVFPEWNRDARSYSATRADQGGLSLRKSPIIWVAPSEFVFLHQSGTELQVVLVDAETLANRTHPLSPEPILGFTPADEQTAARIVATDIVLLSRSTSTCAVRLIFQRGFKLAAVELEW